MSLNKAMVIGRLGKDPEISYTQGGMAICRMSVATSEKKKDRDGNVTEVTEWHTVKAFGKLAEVCQEFLGKGDQAYFEGRIHYDSYEKDGQKKFYTEILADQMRMLGGKREGGEQRTQRAPRSSEPKREAPPPSQADDFADDDIPF